MWNLRTAASQTTTWRQIKGWTLMDVNGHILHKVPTDNLIFMRKKPNLHWILNDPGWSGSKLWCLCECNCCISASWRQDFPEKVETFNGCGLLWACALSICLLFLCSEMWNWSFFLYLYFILLSNTLCCDKLLTMPRFFELNWLHNAAPL